MSQIEAIGITIFLCCITSFANGQTTYYSRQSGAWEEAGSWSTTALGGEAALIPPENDAVVIVGNYHTISVESDDAEALSVEIQPGATLEIEDATGGHDFGTVSGTGTLRLITDDSDATAFPGGAYTDLLGASGGTIEYSGSGTYTVLATPSSFYNLTISGSGSVTLPNTNLNIEGDLSIYNSGEVLISHTANGDLSIGGGLNISSTAAISLLSGMDRTITVAGDIINEGSFQVSGAGSQMHSLSMSGSLTNNGIFDMEGSVSHYCEVSFEGTENATISGSGGTTNFYRIILNKGNAQASELEVTADHFSLSGPTNTTSKALELQQGTFILSAPHTLPLSTGGGDFSIPAGAGLWVNDAGAIAEITSASSNLSLAGLLSLSEGNIYIGDDISGTEDHAIYYSGEDAEIHIEGGVLTVGGEIRPSPTTANLSYTQSGGSVIVANNRSSTESLNNNEEADFCIENGEGSSFMMSGGLLEIVRRNAVGDGKAIRINSGISYEVSGGTVRVLNANTTTHFDVGITSAAPFWNLEIGEGNSFTERVGAPNGGQQDLTVLNDLSINLVGGTFRLFRANASSPTTNDINLNLGGNFALLNGDFESGEPSTISFDGSGLSGQSSPQQISGSPTFYSIELNHTDVSGGLQLASDIIVEGDWTYTAGSLVQNGNHIHFKGSSLQNIAGNSHSFDDIVIDNAAGVSLSAAQLTMNGELNLTEGIFDLAANQLSLTASATITTPSAFDNSRMIISSGEDTALGIEKTFAENSSFLFPMGTATAYTPATLTLSNHSSSGDGSISVNPVAYCNPLAPSASALDYYWIVETSTFSAAPDLTHTYVYDQSDVSGTEASFLDAYFDGEDWQEGVDTHVEESSNTISTASSENLDGYAFTAGYGFSTPTTYYSRVSGDWDTNVSWSTDPSGAPIAGTPPAADDLVIIQAGHTIIIPALTSVNAASTGIEASAILEIQESDASNYAIGTVEGEGTLRFNVSSTPSLPALDHDFISSGGGTIEYAYLANASLPTEQTTYHNLIIAGSYIAYLNADYTIYGDMSVTTSSRLEDNGYTITGQSSNTFTLADGSELRTEGEHNTLAGFGTYDFQSGSTVRFRGDGPQQIQSLDTDAYDKLTLEGEATKSLAGDIEVNGDLTILSGAVLDANGYDITLRGNWRRNPDANSQFIPGEGTVIFDSGASQEIDMISGGSDAETFNHISITNGTVLSLDPVESYQTTQLNINGTLTITSSTLGVGNKPMLISGDLINNGGTFTSTDSVSFEGSSAQTISGDNSLGSLIVDNANGLSIADDASITIANELSLINGNLATDGGTSTVIFDGDGEQQINGAVTFNNLTKLSGDTLTLNGSCMVNGTLTLVEGIINTTDSDLLTIAADGAISGGSVNSYINGPLQHMENSSTPKVKDFPLGSDGYYRPISLNLSQADATERSYTAQLSEGAPASRTLPTTPEELVRVSAIRYYSITQSPAAAVSAATVTIAYNEDDLIDDGSMLRIAKSDGAGNWDNIGGVGSNPLLASPGAYASGSITSSPFTTFSVFVLASASELNNPLPISLVRFEGKAEDRHILLQWTTAWEKNHDYFTIERSVDGDIFTTIGQLDGYGNSNTVKHYQFVDEQPLLGSAYYRLRQMDFDGVSVYSKIVLLNFYPEKAYVADLSPNPAKGESTVLRIGGIMASTKFRVSLMHTSGRIVREAELLTDQAGKAKWEVDQLSELPSGVYSIHLSSAQYSETLRLIIP